ncbi:hypothetical protein H5410_002482 [Solanum commersonii]|uniref:Uncharacterized protein n=1 Tax=Solanum commersonii TaxID=4109 RepID=A0A9J6B1W4_SOLCO|nr:hypothetical protein H5410_002482 [Solanum commersonii]
MYGQGQAPTKIKCFVWLVAKRACMTRGMLVEERCTTSTKSHRSTMVSVLRLIGNNLDDARTYTVTVEFLDRERRR